MGIRSLLRRDREKYKVLGVLGVSEVWGVKSFRKYPIFLTPKTHKTPKTPQTYPLTHTTCRSVCKTSTRSRWAAMTASMSL